MLHEEIKELIDLKKTNILKLLDDNKLVNFFDEYYQKSINSNAISYITNHYTSKYNDDYIRFLYYYCDHKKIIRELLTNSNHYKDILNNSVNFAKFLSPQLTLKEIEEALLLSNQPIKSVLAMSNIIFKELKFKKENVQNIKKILFEKTTYALNETDIEILENNEIDYKNNSKYFYFWSEKLIRYTIHDINNKTNSLNKIDNDLINTSNEKGLPFIHYFIDTIINNFSNYRYSSFDNRNINVALQNLEQLTKNAKIKYENIEKQNILFDFMRLSELEFNDNRLNDKINKIIRDTILKNTHFITNELLNEITLKSKKLNYFTPILIELLQKNKININVNYQYENGNTIIHNMVSFKKCNVELLNILIEKNELNTNLKNKKNKTFINIAMEKNNNEVLSLLEKYILCKTINVNEKTVTPIKKL